MKRIVPMVSLVLVILLFCVACALGARTHITQITTPTPTADPTPISVPDTEAVDLIVGRIRHESPVRLENGAWGYLETDEDSHYVFVWRGNFLLSEMYVWRIIAAWIAFVEKEECDLGIRFGPAWSLEGKPGLDESYFGLFIRAGDEGVFFKMLRIQPPHLQDC